jgi:flagellar secretion chaperone FliS
VNRTDLLYRTSAAQGASGIGVLIALYDTLAGNLRRAAQAERNDDIPQRTREVKHALLVIAHLEDWLERGDGGELADQLRAFYASLRQDLMQAQARRSAHLLEQQMAKVLELRELWQQLELRSVTAAPEILPPVHRQHELTQAPASTERRQLSWSA